MREYTQGRSLFTAPSVESFSASQGGWNIMREFTQGRSLTTAPSVEGVLARKTTWTNTRKYTEGKCITTPPWVQSICPLRKPERTWHRGEGFTEAQTLGKHITHNNHLNVIRESTQEREITSLSMYISHLIDLQFIREHTQCTCCLILLTDNVFTCFYQMKLLLPIIDKHVPVKKLTVRTVKAQKPKKFPYPRVVKRPLLVLTADL